VWNKEVTVPEHILVTGGAGYIGAHACKALARAGYVPVCFDNLSTGWAEAVKFGPLVQGDLMDRASIDAALRDWQPVAVMHFAALSLVGESMADPGRYWRVNVGGALNLIEAAVAAGVGEFVFSSTCATYGDQDGVLLDEDTAQHPITAYGASKLAIEQMLGNFAASHGLRSVIFRYFNVAGADPEGDVGERHEPETHLIPLILQAASGKRAAITVFGRNYSTPDGTCIRDYIHVADLASAHALALDYLAAGGSSTAFNLGNGNGFSVQEVVTTAKAVTKRDIKVVDAPRREGDPAILIADATRARAVLQWQPRYGDLATIISHAWQWELKLSTPT
jgi:UDP-glucose 4-epimerase